MRGIIAIKWEEGVRYSGDYGYGRRILLVLLLVVLCSVQFIKSCR